ncbi:MAG TPA: hypothetical protein VHB30_06195 [Solirubrobacteraceae bacterium]|jgi:hypothetical protein|nr:hypothetical protein [Solirubrobacteraceae bacterium]
MLDRPLVSLAGLVLAAIAATATAASAADPAPLGATQSAALWATLNVCDTPDHPDTLGIRASMPGDGSASDGMFVRFQVQYLQRDGTWKALGPGGDSGFVAIGAAKAKVRETGRLFVLAPPARHTFELRGLVTFEWRDAAGAVLRRMRRATTSGHRSAAGADPQGYSAAVCVMG